jgi:phospholipase C
MRVAALTGAVVVFTGLLAGCSWLSDQAGRPAGDPPGVDAALAGIQALAGIHKIKHVIIVMQENRSFDSYFGTYPGADGIPMRHGRPAVCVPKPGGGCGRPYHLTADINTGGPHSVVDAAADVDGGKMDGFIRQRIAAMARCRPLSNPACPARKTPDLMGYHTAAEIPNYWAYARHFALDDHMFEPVRSWSLPTHLDLVSA